MSIEFYQCSPTNPVVATAISENRSWSSRDWELAKIVKLRAAADRDIEKACAGGLSAGSYPPGAAYTLFQKVPIVEILGDSLSPGAYRITASLEINGTIRNLSAGSVEILRGPPPNTR